MTLELPSKNTLCPVCTTGSTIHLIEIKQLPTQCNFLWSSYEEARKVPKGDLNLGFCTSCGHIYNFNFDPRLMEYTQTYENSLHFSPTFQLYAQSQAKRLVNEYDIRQKDVIEIGSGRGDFLKLICDIGNNHGFGFDPSYIPSDDFLEITDDYRIIQDYYSEKYKNIPADLIISRHVLEHIYQPKTFINNILDTLPTKKAILFFIEVPNVLYIMRDLSIWDLIYEHCSYYNKYSLTKLFNDHQILPLRVHEEYNGQFLCLEGLHSPDNKVSPSQPDPDYLEWIKSLVMQFADHYEKKVTEWNLKIKELNDSDRQVVLWGSGSKGVTFLNTINHSNRIKYVVDINPRKQGKYVSGTGQKIVAPDYLRDYRPDFVIIMNPIYEQEIKIMLNNIGIHPECHVV